MSKTYKTRLEVNGKDEDIDKLKRGETLYSPGLTYSLALQNDGNLCIYKKGKDHALWSAHTRSKSNVLCNSDAKLLRIQSDGNLCVYNSDSRFNVNTCLWATNTNQPKTYDDYQLVLTDLGVLYLFSANANHTHTIFAPAPSDDNIGDPLGGYQMALSISEETVNSKLSKTYKVKKEGLTQFNGGICYFNDPQDSNQKPEFEEPTDYQIGVFRSYCQYGRKIGKEYVAYTKHDIEIVDSILKCLQNDHAYFDCKKTGIPQIKVIESSRKKVELIVPMLDGGVYFIGHMRNGTQDVLSVLPSLECPLYIVLEVPISQKVISKKEDERSDYFEEEITELNSFLQHAGTLHGHSHDTRFETLWLFLDFSKPDEIKVKDVYFKLGYEHPFEEAYKDITLKLIKEHINNIQKNQDSSVLTIDHQLIAKEQKNLPLFYPAIINVFTFFGNDGNS
ncbi:MAG: hypothetical protein AAGA77_13600, partial [Bacteroidota bacterium]